MRTMRLVYSLMACASAALLAVPPPAFAAVNAKITIDCTAKLPTYPTAAGVGGTCDGGARVVAGGLAGDVPYALNGRGGFTSTFNYNENCVAGEPAPVAGTAIGMVTITGVPVPLGPGSPLPATVTANFSWTRAGGTAVIVTTETKITFANGVKVTADRNGAGKAVFAPLAPIGTCAAPVANQKALVKAVVKNAS